MCSCDHFLDRLCKRYFRRDKLCDSRIYLQGDHLGLESAIDYTIIINEGFQTDHINQGSYGSWDSQYSPQGLEILEFCNRSLNVLGFSIFLLKIHMKL